MNLSAYVQRYENELIDNLPFQKKQTTERSKEQDNCKDNVQQKTDGIKKSVENHEIIIGKKLFQQEIKRNR